MNEKRDHKFESKKEYMGGFKGGKEKEEMIYDYIKIPPAAIRKYFFLFKKLIFI